MKRKSFLLAAGLIMSAVTFSACDKSSDSETNPVGPTGASKKLSRIIYQTDDGGGIEKRFTWDGEFLSKVQNYIHIGQDPSSYWVFYNDGKRLIGSESYRVRNNGDGERSSSTEYTYDGNNIVRVKQTKYEYEDDGSIIENGWELWEMSYTGGKMTTVVHSEDHNSDDREEQHYTWSGNNIIGVQGIELYRYGNMKNPLWLPCGASIEYSSGGELIWINDFAIWCENLVEQLRTGETEWVDMEERLNWTITTDEDGYPVKYVCDGDYYRGIIILEYEE